MATESNPPPSVSWAQTKDKVFVIFNVQCDKPDLKIEKQSIYFKGVCLPEEQIHEVSIPLYGEIFSEKSKISNKGRLIEVVLIKVACNERFWPTLTSDKKKHHWLKIDFNRWRDEDDSEEEYGDMNDMFSSKLEMSNEDSSSAEEEDIPDLE